MTILVQMACPVHVYYFTATPSLDEGSARLAEHDDEDHALRRGKLTPDPDLSGQSASLVLGDEV